jgi:hypothetical protein
VFGGAPRALFIRHPSTARAKKYARSFAAKRPTRNIVLCVYLHSQLLQARDRQDTRSKLTVTCNSFSRHFYSIPNNVCTCYSVESSLINETRNIYYKSEKWIRILCLQYLQ